MAGSPGMLAWLSVGFALTMAGQAVADHQPVIVVPGRAGVAVMIDGYDARGAVVYGDTGLYRPGHVYPQIQGPLLITRPSPRGYYPSTGRPPRIGRKEIDPVRGTQNATDRDYYRSWSVRSAPNAVTEYPPFDPPAVILAPRGRPRVTKP